MWARKLIGKISPGCGWCQPVALYPGCNEKGKKKEVCPLGRALVFLRGCIPCCPCLGTLVSRPPASLAFQPWRRHYELPGLQPWAGAATLIPLCSAASVFLGWAAIRCASSPVFSQPGLSCLWSYKPNKFPCIITHIFSINSVPLENPK